MKSKRPLLTLVRAFLVVFPTALSQAQPPTIQDYAKACYLEIGAPPANTFPLSCTDGTLLNNNGGAIDPKTGMCPSPSWAPTHRTVGNVNGAAPYQCLPGSPLFPGSYVLPFGYTTKDQGTVAGALLCKNENPDDTLKAPAFDYISMILYNTVSGKSCWFTTPKDDVFGVRQGTLRNGAIVPNPGVPNPIDQAGNDWWQAPQASSKVQCWRCHDNGVWMNGPWLYVSNKFTDLKNAPRGAPYNFATTAAPVKYGFEQWPSPVYISPAKDTCTSCHKLGAGQSPTLNGKTYVSNTYNEWLGYVTGGAQSPVGNGNGVKVNPPGSNADPTNVTPQVWPITHWMPPGRENRANPSLANYEAQYAEDILAAKKCMAAVGKFANTARAQRGATEKDVIAAIRAQETGAKGDAKDKPFGLDGCHADARTWAVPPPFQPNGIGAKRGQLNLSSPADDTVGEVDTGLTLTVQPVGPDGSVLPTINKMMPGDAPVPIPSGSSLTLSWDPGPNTGCSILASFPPGVSVPNPPSPGQTGYASGGSNWLDETPQMFGPLTEPGVYTFNFDCGFQTAAEVVTQTHISLNLVTNPPTSANPPTLLTLFTATDRRNAETTDWTSYANPQNSYTDPVVIPGQVPQTDIPVGASDTVLISWVAENVAPDSCSLAELGGGTSGTGPIAGASGEIGITLGSAAARVFQLTCTDLNNQTHFLNAKIHQAPPVQMNVTTTPDHGTAGATYVNVTASGFPAGTVTPANVVVTLSSACGGSPLSTTLASSVTAIIGTSKRVQFLVPGLDPGVYYVAISDLAVGDANFASSNCSKISITAP
jgi:hypothetical protein